MKRNYLGVLEEIKVNALAHPQVKSVDDGRELEFDTKKSNLFPRVFIRTDTGTVQGGEGTVELTITFSILVMDRLNVKRTNTNDVLNETHSILTDLLANLNKAQLIRLEDNPGLDPLHDYQDTQTAGWIAVVQVYLDSGFECYPIPE